MENLSAVEAVERMKEYLDGHYHAADPGELAARAGYSPRHCERLFKQITGRSVGEYVRLLRLTDAARRLADGRERILDVALAHDYDSHEGFTKAFAAAFGVTPSRYRKGDTPIPYFIPYPLRPFHNRGELPMEIKRTCTATYLIRPARRLVFLPSKTATDYFSFCEEVGCDWAGLLDSFPSRLDTVALLTLPPALIPEGFGPCAGGIELPAGWSGAVPAGYHTADLEMNEMLFIASPPYEEEAAFSAAIAECYDAHAGYDPALYGYEYAEELAPAMNFGAETATGARIAFPVRKTR